MEFSIYSINESINIVGMRERKPMAKAIASLDLLIKRLVKSPSNMKFAIKMYLTVNIIMTIRAILTPIFVLDFLPQGHLRV